MKLSRSRAVLLASGGALLLLLAGGLFLGACVFAAPHYKGPKSGHFDGERFLNREPTEHHGVGSVVKWMATRERGEWPAFTEAEPKAPPPTRVGQGEMRVTFVGHATLLVQLDGVNLLTDPHFSERASPLSFAGPSRAQPPGIRFEDLPPIDAVLISHNHYDHLDLPTLRRLAEEHSPKLLVPLGNSALLAREGIAGAEDLDWDESAEVAGVRVSCVPARHFSSRGLTDRDRTLWSGWVVEGSAGSAYFAGDTGYGAHFAEVGQRYGPVRLALLPIGAYLPRWFMSPVHVDPGEAVQAAKDLGAQTSVAMHFGTFPLADEGMLEPVRDLTAALKARPLPLEQAFWVLQLGEGRDVPALPAAD